jgi:hypothetical protein
MASMEADKLWIQYGRDLRECEEERHLRISRAERMFEKEADSLHHEYLEALQTLIEAEKMSTTTRVESE